MVPALPVWNASVSNVSVPNVSCVGVPPPVIDWAPDWRSRTPTKVGLPALGVAHFSPVASALSRR